MNAARLPHAARLHQRGDFARIQRGRDVVNGRYFRLRFAASGAAWPRLGLAVSRRVSKLAVERNRIKRCVRTSFRHHRADLPAVDLLLVARAEAANVAGTELTADLETLWRKLVHLKPTANAGTIAR